MREKIIGAISLKVSLGMLFNKIGMRIKPKRINPESQTNANRSRINLMVDYSHGCRIEGKRMVGF
jgi:hypothetical protein